MRAAIAEGMTVITQAGNKEWVENMARRPHTLQPDILAKNASRLNVVTVDDEREIKDQTMTVMLYHVAGNPHSDTMLMAYIPRDRVLIEVDAFSPGSQVNPYAANLLENIQKRNLRVDKIVPLHGAIAPFAELVKVTGGKDELMRTFVSLLFVIRSFDDRRRATTRGSRSSPSRARPARTSCGCRRRPTWSTR